MIGRLALAPILVLAVLICACSGVSSNPAAPTSENTPQNESVWAVHYNDTTNTSQLQAVLIANGSITVSEPFELTGLFLEGGTDPNSQLMFGEVLSSDNLFLAHRQLLAFHYDGSSARQLSATEIPLAPGNRAESIAVVPALKAIYLFSSVTGNEDNDMPGQVLLFHYGEDGSLAEPVDITPALAGATTIFSDLAYGEKTSLLYGVSFNFAHTEPGSFPAFATVNPDGVASSFTPFQIQDSGPPPSSVDVCLGGGGSKTPLAYTHNGVFGLSYNGEQNAVTVESVSDGVANFASRTDVFGTDCAGPALSAAALDESHKAFYAVLQTFDPFFETPVSAVLARFTFNPATGKISPQPVQLIPIENKDHIYVPRFGSRLFVFNADRVIAYTLTGNGPENPQSVPLAFPPQMLFGDTPQL